MPRGRPTMYRAEFCEKVANLAIQGATDMEIADFLGISVATLFRWKAAHPDFREALKFGKENANARVVRSLYQRAVGFEYDAVKIFMPAGAKKPVFAKYREYVVPETTAAIFWLKNRQPGEWRDRSELSGPDGGPIPIALDRESLIAKLRPRTTAK